MPSWDSSPSRGADTWFAIRLAAWQARRVVAGLAVVGAVALASRLLLPAPPELNDVVVARHDLEVGAALTAADLRVVQQPAHLTPAGALTEPDALVGREPTVAVPAGLPVVESLLGGDRFDVDPPPGSVVVPVRLADPAVAGVLRAGDRVDLVTSDGGAPGGAPAPEVLALRALVLQSADVRDELLGLGEEVVLTVVAVSPEEGRRLAAVTSWGAVAAVLVG